MTSRLTPEEEHLHAQERILTELTEALAAKETELATDTAELARFRADYLRRFAPLYVELDRLHADIEALAGAAEEPVVEQELARDRARQAAGVPAEEQEWQADAPASHAGPGPRTVDPGLRDLYRQAAKRFHPDMAATDEERVERTRIMAAVNEAYARGDAEAIRRILEGESARPEAIKGDDVPSRLVRVLRQIAQVRARLTDIAALREALEVDDLWRLFVRCREVWAAGGDPLAEDEAGLRSEIGDAHARLAALLRQRVARSGR